jgi:hypothetical protein
MAGKMPGKTNKGKRRNSEKNHRNSSGGRSGGRQGNNSRGGRGGRGRGRGGHGGRGHNKKTAQLQKKMTMNIQTFKHGIQVGFQKPISIFIERNVDQKGQASKEERKR